MLTPRIVCHLNDRIKVCSNSGSTITIQDQEQRAVDDVVHVHITVIYPFSYPEKQGFAWSLTTGYGQY